jgi:hypothetical protein
MCDLLVGVRIAHECLQTTQWDRKGQRAVEGSVAPGSEERAVEPAEEQHEDDDRNEGGEEHDDGHPDHE